MISTLFLFEKLGLYNVNSQSYIDMKKVKNFIDIKEKSCSKVDMSLIEYNNDDVQFMI